MFHEASPQAPLQVVPFLQWFVLRVAGGHGDAGRGVLEDAMRQVPQLQELRRTPQGAPWHVEGPMVSDHVVRMLAVLQCVEQGGKLAEIEEFAREKDLALEVEALENTVRMHATFLRAFALAHDVAKPELLTFDAAQHTKGAAEGFRGKRHPTQPELARYDKLLRAFAVHRAHHDTAKVLTDFFAEYGIETHYDGHGPRAAGADYAHVREAVMQYVGLPASYAKLLAELLRYHIDALFDITAEKYRVIAARAGKAGLNVDLVLDLTLAHVFLDGVAGTLTTTGAKTDLVIRHMRAEREAFPARHEARETAKMREKKQAEKDMYTAEGLDGDQVFALLGTPIGPERGVVMRQIMDAVRDPSLRVDFGGHTQEMVRRIASLRARLSRRA